MRKITAQIEAKIIDYIGYSVETGLLHWKRKPNRNIVLGSSIGKINADGYLRFNFCNRSFFTHRVAWFLIHGAWPVNQIDHINRDPSDNRICNLRDVPQEKNMQNKISARCDSSSRLLGAYRNPNSVSNPWESSIKANGEKYNLGRFSTPEAAHSAYLMAKEKLHDTGR